MTISVLAISFDAHHAARLAEFWAQALHRTLNDDATEDFASIAADTGLGAVLMFHKVPEDKTVTVPAKAEGIAAAIAGAKLVRVPHAGHMVTLEQPQAATRAIRSFLDGLADRVGTSCHCTGQYET